MNDTEIWKTATYIKSDGEIVNFSNRLEVSNRGGSRWAKDYTTAKRATPRILERAHIGRGYKYYKHNAKPYMGSEFAFHRIILCTFKGYDWDFGLECDHIDNNPSNNDLSNLQWLTRNQNMVKREPYSTSLSYIVVCPNGNRYYPNEGLIALGNELGLNATSFQSQMSRSGHYKGYKLIRNSTEDAG